jgi:hypothetical protein
MTQSDPIQLVDTLPLLYIGSTRVLNFSSVQFLPLVLIGDERK